MKNIYEPCARIDGGINILKNGEVIWETPDLDTGHDWDNPAPNADVNSPEWKRAIIICELLTKNDSEDVVIMPLKLTDEMEIAWCDAPTLKSGYRAMIAAYAKESL